MGLLLKNIFGIIWKKTNNDLVQILGVIFYMYQKKQHTRSEFVDVAVYNNFKNELYSFSDEDISALKHHGILGMKWGIRRYQNEDGTLTEEGKRKYAENYTDKQRSRDRQVYSRGAERRINKKMLEGRGIQEARSYEAERIDKYRNAAQNVKRKGITQTGATIGGIAGGLLSGYAVDAVQRYVNSPVMKDTPINRFIGQNRQTINAGLDFLNKDSQGRVIRTAVGSAAGAGLLGYVIPETASRTIMRSGGYSPSKRKW